MPLRWPFDGLAATVALLAAAWMGLGAQAQQVWRDVYSCGGSKGHSYYIGEGWMEDVIAQGVIILKRRGDEFDVHIGDASGSFLSARAEGATAEQDGVVQVVAM
jgi:hypothetical protein